MAIIQDGNGDKGYNLHIGGTDNEAAIVQFGDNNNTATNLSRDGGHIGTGNKAGILQIGDSNNAVNNSAKRLRRCRRHRSERRQATPPSTARLAPQATFRHLGGTTGATALILQNGNGNGATNLQLAQLEGGNNNAGIVQDRRRQHGSQFPEGGKNNVAGIVQRRRSNTGTNPRRRVDRRYALASSRAAPATVAPNIQTNVDPTSAVIVQGGSAGNIGTNVQTNVDQFRRGHRPMGSANSRPTRKPSISPGSL